MRLPYRWLALFSCALWLIAACGDDDTNDTEDPDGGGKVDASNDAGFGGKGGHAGESDAAGSGGGAPEGGSGGTGETGGAGGDSMMDASVTDANATSECGDGVVEGDEDCDDDNTDDGDGCTASCAFESGWVCSTDQPTACSPRCGDGKRVGAETSQDRCDDDDTDDADGCDSDCHVEGGFECSGEPSVCSSLCGNGTLNPGETCDDGSSTNSIVPDGCHDCQVETHWNCSGEPSTCTPDLDANIVFSGSQIAALSTRKPSLIQAPATVIGLVVGDVLVAIDRRPLNGFLYGLGYNASAGTAQLYMISTESALAAPIGTAAKFVAIDGSTPVNVAGTQFGMDFNPTVDRVRVVNNQGQNFRINPNNGAFVDGDGTNPGVQPDGAVNGGTASLDECAYTNNSLNQTVTTLYTIDHVTKKLYIQNPSNTGTQTLGIDLQSNIDFVWGLDIGPGINAATSNAAISGSGYALVTLVNETQTALMQIDLTTASAPSATPIGTNAVSLALQDVDSLPMFALTSDGQTLLRFESTNPGGAVSVAVNALNSGETLVDIDFRPRTGQLYALGIDPTANTGSLYTIDPGSGSATVVGSAGQIALVEDDGSTAIVFPTSIFSWSIDFNAVPDRLRVMNLSGLNFRVNPDTGVPADGSGMPGTNPDTTVSGLQAGSSGLAGAAYTNSWLGSTATTLYVTDAASNQLCYSSNPNGGTVTGCIAVTLGSQALDILTNSELDFDGDVRVGTNNAAATGVVHAVTSVDGKGHLFKIDLATGAATDRGQIGTGPELAGFAVGHSNVK